MQELALRCICFANDIVLLEDSVKDLKEGNGIGDKL